MFRSSLCIQYMYIYLILIYVDLYRANWNNHIGMALAFIDLRGSQGRQTLGAEELCKDL